MATSTSAASSISASDSKLSRRMADLEDSIPENLEVRIIALEAATAQIPTLLARIAELESRPTASAAPVKKETAPRAGRPKKADTLIAPPPLPEGSEEEPEESAYRLSESDIRDDVCVGRLLVNPDKRWSIAVYAEAQCGADVCDDGEGDLCKTCYGREQKYAENPKTGSWNGRVTEDPLPCSHMLGTAWAISKMLKWKGGAAGGAGDSASTASGETGTSSKMTAAEIKAAAKAKKDAEKVAAKAAKEAEKQAKAAAKEAEKAAKIAEKEALKAAKAAEKEAAKAAKEAAKASKAVAAPKPATKKVPLPTPVAAKADTSASAVAVEGEMACIGGTIYMKRGDYLYEYDPMEEAVGAYVGKLLSDGETIDKSAEEPTPAAE
jgi:hypothetical protein